MKIVFVYPETEHLGVEYLSACLKKAGHDVELMFDPMLFGTYFLSVPSLRAVFDYREALLDRIAKMRPQLVCFSVFSDYYGWACGLSVEIKEKISCPIIFGGIHPSSVPEVVIQNDFVDFVCVGEGEEALVELADALASGRDPTGIKNIWAKRGGITFKNECRPLIQELDSLPYPDKGLFRKEYPGFSKEVYTVITARGCVNACTYCYNSYFKKFYKGKGKYMRRRSPANVLEELRMAKDAWGIERVSFFDDLFISDIDWSREFLKQYAYEIALPFFCHVHPSFVDSEIVGLLEEARCSSVTMGVQTFNAAIRREYLHRYESNEVIESAIRLFSGTKIFLFTNIILGLPGQDEAVMVEDVRLSTLYKADMVATNWLRYYPKVELVSISEQLGVLNQQDRRQIEQNKRYLPYSLKGNTYNTTGARLRNLFSVCQVIPEKIMDYILEHRGYRWIPAWNMRFPITMFVFLHRKLMLHKKNPFTYIGMAGVIRFYWHYIKRRIFYLAGIRG